MNINIIMSFSYILFLDNLENNLAVKVCLENFYFLKDI